MVLWAMLQVSRCVANNIRVCCEAGFVKVLMAYKLLLATYVGGSGGGCETIGEELCYVAALCWISIVYGLSGSLILGAGVRACG